MQVFNLKKAPCNECSFMAFIIWIQKTLARSEVHIAKTEAAIWPWLGKLEIRTKY